MHRAVTGTQHLSLRYSARLAGAKYATLERVA